jgi:hypothetical protein
MMHPPGIALKLPFIRARTRDVGSRRDAPDARLQSLFVSLRYYRINRPDRFSLPLGLRIGAQLPTRALLPR